MKVIKSDNIKENLINRIKRKKDKKRLLVISQSKSSSVLAYKKAILKRCKDFDIEVIDKIFTNNQDHLDIINYCNTLNDIDGFIILQPLSKNTDLTYLRRYMPFNDLDGFTYESLGKIMDKDFSHMPQTARSVIKFIEYMNIDLSGKDIIVANSNNVIGKPLSMYLNSKKATVTIFNSKSENQKEKVKKCHIFISAIGDANFYNKDYFTDGQILIDVGTSFIEGKMYGDIDYDTISHLDIDVVKSNNWVGFITTLSLIESLVYSDW